MTETQDPIRIRGEFTPDPQICKFHVSRPVFDDDHTYAFTSAAEAPGSALVSALFDEPDVAEVRILRDTFTITKRGDAPWPKLAGKLIPVIREALEGAEAVVDPEVLQAMRDAPLDEATPEKIEALMAESLNPALAAHGGWVKLAGVEGHDIHIEFGGGCQGCASSQATLKFGIARAIKDAFPAVRDVVDVTDHEAGTQPYYT